MRLVEELSVGEGLQRVQLDLQATGVQLRTFFREKDQAQSALEEVLGQLVTWGDVVCITTGFIAAYILKASEKQEYALKMLSRLRLQDDDKPKGQHFEQFLRQVQIQYEVSRTKEAATIENFRLLTFFLAKRYKLSDHQIDHYFCMLAAFRFFNGNRKYFFDNPCDTSDDDEDVCPICSDDLTRSRDFACGSCKRFLSYVIDTRQVLSLRCRKLGQCRDELDNIDIVCKKCRLNAAKSKGILKQMLQARDEEQGALLGLACCACNVEDVPVMPFLGIDLCQDCVFSFRECLIGLKYKSLECKCSFDQFQPANGETQRCLACLRDRFQKLRLFHLYEVKSGDLLDKVDPSSFIPREELTSPDDKGDCSACGQPRLGKTFRGIPVCETCIGFFMCSMEDDRYETFCCPQGESGKVCAINTPWTRCKYCWVKRLEVEGLFVRWFAQGETEDRRGLVNGRADMEDEILDSINCEID